MKPARHLLNLATAASLAIGLALPLASPARAEVPVAQAQHILLQSGAWASLGQVSPAVQTYLLAAVEAEPGGESTKRERLLPLSQALQRAYAPDKLRADVIQQLARQLTGDDAAMVQAWFDTPLGRQVASVEGQIAEGSDDPASKLQGAMQAWRQLAPERQALLSAVVSANQAAPLQVEVLIQSLQAIHRGTSTFMPKAAKVSAKDLKSRLDAQREELTASFQSAALALSTGFYASLSDQQLADYGQFLASPLGQRLLAVQHQAMVKAVRNATEEAGRGTGAAGTATPAGLPRQSHLLEQLNRGGAAPTDATQR
ncbi:MAG: hypothetical protein RI907_878 [Pseudomonadota bacterium]|jgi:hypothetical protein